MARNAFDRLYGTEQGRISSPIGWDPPEGAWLLALGSDPVGRLATLSPGDYAGVFQTGTFGPAKIVRCKARLRGPLTALPGDMWWEAQLRVNGAVVTSRRLATRQLRTLSDMGWPVTHLAGAEEEIGFRLVLLGTTTPTSDIEIPAFYVDALALDTAYAPRPQLLNRNPEPNETGIDSNTSIALDLVDVGPDGVSIPDTEIFVNGVLAFAAGVFQSGFNGAGSSSTAILASTQRIVIDPTVAFDSEEVVTVTVVSRTVGAIQLSTLAYSFEIADVRSPRVAGAVSLTETIVRVTFDENMNEATVTSPSSYTFTRAPGAIAVPVLAASVAVVDSLNVDVTINQAITPGVLYTVTVTNAQDRVGNTVSPPFDSATFAGYVCTAPDDRDFALWDMIPDKNREEDDSGDLAKFIAVFQEVGDLLLCEIDRFTDIIDPDIAAIEFVDAMLIDLGNPFSFVLEEIDRRRLARNLVTIYKQKGVAIGIIGTIRFFLAIETTITPFGFAPVGLGDWVLGDTWVLGSSNLSDQLTFAVNVPQPLTDDQRDRMTEIVEYMKRAEEHFVIIEPAAPPVTFDHVELGISELGTEWDLH